MGEWLAAPLGRRFRDRHPRGKRSVSVAAEAAGGCRAPAGKAPGRQAATLRHVAPPPVGTAPEAARGMGLH